MDGKVLKVYIIYEMFPLQGNQEEEYNLRWRKSTRSSSSASCRLMEKRQAVSYEQQVRGKHWYSTMQYEM